jgi:hypothetical protein
MRISLILFSIIFLPALSIAESPRNNSSQNTYEIIKVEKISPDLLEVEASRSFSVAQEIRRHYQTKRYASENMLLQVNCIRSQVNVISYQWYADPGLQGTVVYASQDASGWYSASKDAAIHLMVAKVCPAE